MKLNVFFSNRDERVEFIKKQFRTEKITVEGNHMIFPIIPGVESLRLKNTFQKVPGYWVEFQFSKTACGKKLYNQLVREVQFEKIDGNVFYPTKNTSYKDLEEGWAKKYNFLQKGYDHDEWKLFFEEIKTHVKYNRMDIAYNGLMLFLKYNPFYLKKYRRSYLFEELAYYYEEAGNLGKAMKCLHLQSILQPDSGDPYLNMSSFCIINGMEEEAVEICREGLKKNPYNQYLVSNLIIALNSTGEYEYAIEYLKKVIDKRPDNPYYWKLMGDILYEIENNKGALECYKQALKRKRRRDEKVDELEIDIYNGMAACYYEEGEDSDAVEFYKKALHHAPDDSFTLLSLGQIYLYKLKDIKKAFQYTKILVEKMPENGYGQYQMGIVYSQLGYYEKARWHLYKARRIMPHYKPIQDAINLLKKKIYNSSS